jgi:hypothetical protein
MRAVIALALLLAACGFHPAAQSTDGGVDGAIDGPPDAMVLSGRQQMELVAGAGRLQAGTMTIDVEVGRPSSNTTTVTAGTITIEAAPVIAP